MRENRVFDSCGTLAHVICALLFDSVWHTYNVLRGYVQKHFHHWH